MDTREILDRVRGDANLLAQSLREMAKVSDPVLAGIAVESHEQVVRIEMRMIEILAAIQGERVQKDVQKGVQIE